MLGPITHPANVVPFPKSDPNAASETAGPWPHWTELPRDALRDLGPIETAYYIRDFIRSRGIPAKEAAYELGYSRAHVLNMLRLLNLPREIQKYITNGRLSAGHGKVLVKMRDPLAAARLIISRDLSVRQTETLARRLRHVNPDGTLPHKTAIPFTYEAERLMEDALNLKVRFVDRAGRGTITIHYRYVEQAQMIVDLLTKTYFGGDVKSL